MKNLMKCEIQCSSSCPTSRETLFLWGYGKLAIGVFMLLAAIIPGGEEVGIYLLYEKSASKLAASVIYIILSAMWIMDLVFHALLVAGVHKGKMNLLKAYYIYSNALWILVPLLGFIYYTIQSNDMLWYVDVWHGDLRLKTLAHLCTMFVTLIIQTFVLLPLRYEIENIYNAESFNIGIKTANNKQRAYIIGLTYIKIEKPNNKKNSNVKQEKDQNNVVEKIETTCDKAMLIE